jgi:hypothetical protein
LNCSKAGMEAVVRSVWHERGLVKLHVEYAPGSFATILSDEIVPISKRTETAVSNRETNSDTYF